MTVYRLDANTDDPAAVRRVFQVKERPPSHRLGGARPTSRGASRDRSLVHRCPDLQAAVHPGDFAEPPYLR
ncbi:hypothetical protein [Streptomyces sp. enrichment culture]|uniref:hypothetical protein n=1 Tax=Streptomyces sp. enrichment culture TaxID=1795815 RepID=UPI003F560436